MSTSLKTIIHTVNTYETSISKMEECNKEEKKLSTSIERTKLFIEKLSKQNNYMLSRLKILKTEKEKLQNLINEYGENYLEYKEVLNKAKKLKSKIDKSNKQASLILEWRNMK